MVARPDNYPQEPAQLWEHFFQISQIPRPSGEEAALRDHIIDLANSCACPSRIDTAGNLLVSVPGSVGRELEGSVIVQNHLDMVTVKTADSDHDFSADPLSLQVVDGWLSADRTTLGADNGLGCAAALALMTDSTVSHPPLELLFTVEEETGLYGATDLDPDLLQGERMLNLDTEDWGELFVGCAGGQGWILRRGLQRAAGTEGAEYWRLTLRGLAGGHSGIQIHQQLGNAIKLLGQWLVEARPLGVRLVSLEGGVAHNVIPREASLVFSCASGEQAALESLNERLQCEWGSYLPAADAQLALSLEPASAAQPLAQEEQRLLEQVLLLFPHGARNYNAEQPADLVDLSINLAILRVQGDEFYLETTLRYFNAVQARALANEVLAIAQWLQAEVEETINYPGWEPDFSNPLLKLSTATYSELFGGKPAIKAIHAGLECGILKSKRPSIDVVSFGPTIRGAHSPSERLEIQTVTPFWQLLTALLQRI